MRQQIEVYDPNQFLNANFSDLVSYFAQLAEVEPLQLLESESAIDQAETKVDVRHRFDYAVRDSSKPTLVPGISVALHIPFTGEKTLLYCEVFVYGPPPPFAEVIGSTIIIEYVSPNPTKEEINRHFDNEKAMLQKHVQRLNDHRLKPEG